VLIWFGNNSAISFLFERVLIQSIFRVLILLGKMQINNTKRRRRSSVYLQHQLIPPMPDSLIHL